MERSRLLALPQLYRPATPSVVHRVEHLLQEHHPARSRRAAFVAAVEEEAAVAVEAVPAAASAREPAVEPKADCLPSAEASIAPEAASSVR